MKNFDIVITPDRVQKEYLKDIFRYRELFYFMAWRDIVVRYKQTFLGVIWAIVRPLITMAVFAFVFGRVAQLASEQINYPLFVLAGLLPWMLFSNSIVETSQCLIQNAPMISKIYFPRIILPISLIMVHFIDFLICFVFLLLLLGVDGTLQFPYVLGFPVFIFLTLLFCLGSSLWLSAMTVRYRDFRFSSPFWSNLEFLFPPWVIAAF